MVDLKVKRRRKKVCYSEQAKICARPACVIAFGIVDKFAWEKVYTRPEELNSNAGGDAELDL